MRKRLAWFGAILLAAVAILVGLATIFGRPSDSPFAFLHGHPPLKLSPAETGRTLGSRFERVTYSYPADYAATVQQARTELLPMGYREVKPQDGSVLFVGSDYFKTYPGPTQPDVPFVMVYEDWQYGAEKNDAGEGWVTVFMHGQPPLRPFDKLRQWLGI